jgi:hypothetical protein
MRGGTPCASARGQRPSAPSADKSEYLVRKRGK